MQRTHRMSSTQIIIYDLDYVCRPIEVMAVVVTVITGNSKEEKTA